MCPTSNPNSKTTRPRSTSWPSSATLAPDAWPTLQGPLFYIDFEGREGDPNIDGLLNDVDKLGLVRRMPEREVPWFPVNIRELDLTKETIGVPPPFPSLTHPVRRTDFRFGRPLETKAMA